MLNNKEVSKETPPANKFWQHIKKNGFTVLMLIFIGVMFVSPEAKSFVLRQLMATGLFNASIDNKIADNTNPANLDFDFSDENGNVQNTSSLRGKVVFINFWASWCPPCRAEFPSIETFYSKFKDNPDVFFLTINQDDDLATGRAYLNKEKYAVPLFTTNGNIPREVYAGALPTTIVLDKNGKIRYHNTGFANYASAKFLKQIEELIRE
ncbi:TlpA family protein disulfide reductase [Sphingobacterium alkalisoli]|uniref:TlpA family protein disulfide reductase n=1 Tax=Sphingobacterium alkalisoli TaxID=1874115 RepID=A0A4U0GUR7_9SPHI|nr:TlpA disulfide reductase family protein [Sphingobacterium alkalisoli]TJY62636.1 TlpA family protein disulfide reductase [Sphingobacterium alkalisoli]GGH27922.1 thiol-disulfide oxidoreductase ResA [Sphingobacterium alkalisoli]